jgi:hypothetical protein
MLLREPPSISDIEGVATALAIMVGTAEMSNWLRYFPELHRDVEGHYKVDHFAAGSLKHTPESEALRQALTQHLLRGRSDGTFVRLVPPFDPGSEMRQLLDGFLKQQHGVTVAELEEFSGCVADMYNPESMGSTVLVGTYDGFAERLHERARLAKSKARTFLDLVLLSFDKASASPLRDFLLRSNRKRMGYYGGLRIQNMALPGRLHSPFWPDNPEVWSFSNADAVMLSAFSCIEAVQLQLNYLVTGQVDHLGLQPSGMKELKWLHQKYRVDCFEGEVRGLLAASGWTVIGPVKKVYLDGKWREIPCGEIDALAVSPDGKRLLLVEAKCLPFSTDVKMWHGDASDFNKDFVPKIERKLKWCLENLAVIEHCFRTRHVPVDKRPSTATPLFATLRPHISAVLQSRYRVLHMAALQRVLEVGAL